jgi:CheY-like chemotaxis protein
VEEQMRSRAGKAPVTNADAGTQKSCDGDRLGSLRVLVADDDEATRTVMRSALEEEGYTVIEAAHGKAALAVVAGSRGPLIALLDQRMPGLLGSDVLDAALGGRLIGEDRRYILLTASPHLLPHPYSHPWFQRLVPVLSKPFDLDALLEVVASARSSLVRG